MNIKGKTAIIGYGETEFAKRNPGNRTNYSENCNAARLAIEDAGISKDEIDGLIAICPLDEPPSWTEDLQEYLQLHPRYLDYVYRGGASGNAAIFYSAAAIAAGLCETVLIIAGGVMDPKRIYEFGQGGPAYERDFDSIYGPMFNNSSYALIKQRYMHEFGAADEQFARVTVNARYHASMFPNALLKNRLTVEDVVNSRIICDPLHLYEIVMPCIGGLALVMTSAEKAKRAKNPPAYLLGGGQSFDRGLWSPAYGYYPSLTTSPVKRSAAQAFEMAQLSVNDMDFFEIYDCYTITVTIALEDVGLAKKGEGAKFVEKTDFGYNGGVPLNTDGGQLGRGQPNPGINLMHSIEAARQLMGRAGPLQVKGAKYGLSNGNGGAMADQCTLIFGRDPE